MEFKAGRWDYEVLTRENSEHLMKLILLENKGVKCEWEKQGPPFLCSVIKKRVETRQLPVKLTNTGLMAIYCFTETPAGAVIILIDFLTKYEGETFTANRLCELYPWGFYNDKAFEDYIDNYLKPHKTKWSELY